MILRFSLIDFTFNPLGVTTVLTAPPAEWEKIKIKANRDIKSHGILFEVTDIALGFAGAGALVINTAKNAKGADAETELLVEIQCDDNDTYDVFYTGRLQYDLIKETFADDCYIEIPVEQTGCLQTFKNRMEQKVDLESLLANDRTTVLPSYSGLGIEVQIPAKKLIFIDLAANISGYVASNSFPGSAIWQYGLLFPEVLRRDLDSFAPDINDFDTGLPILIIDSIERIDCGGNSLEIHIELDIDLQLNTTLSPDPVTTAIQLLLIHKDSADTTLSTQTLFSSMDLADGTLHHIPIVINNDYPYTISTGDYFELIFVFGVTNAAPTVDYVIEPHFTNGIFKATIISDCSASDAKMFLINESFSRISEIITDDCLKVYSEYFGRTDSLPFSVPTDGCGSLEAITNGLFIRRASRTDSTPVKIFVSFKELFDGINAIHNIGMGITTQYGQDVLQIEPMPFWYEFVVIHEINEPMEMVLSFDTKRAYSLIKMGYARWETEYVGGLDEVQTKREYRTDSKTINSDSVDKKGGTLEQLSKLIASTYAIELTRRQGESTEDFTYDNDIFIMCLMRGSVGQDAFLAEIPASYYTENILSSTNLLNIRITPVRNLLRWFKTIAASWSKQYLTVAKELIFGSGEGNYIAGIEVVADDDCFNELQPSTAMVQDPDGILYENETITKNIFKYAANAKPIWEPELIKVKAPISWTEWKLIKANPYQLIKVTKRGNSYYGWVDELSYEPNEGMANFTLLRAYDAENRI